jgi:Fe2+ or Zn2+ uptake regulation protein
MSKKKGLSLEEKRQRMLELFHEKRDVFQLKELEKLAPKEKGITFQSVKEVVQALVDDNLVDSEKIGSSIYFWAFPSKAFNARNHKILELKAKVTDARNKLRGLEAEVKANQVEDTEAQEREAQALLLKDLQAKRDDLRLQVDRFKDCDPRVLAQMKGELTVARDAANRWTDNVHTIKSWCKNKFALEEAQINKQFAIPEDLDYLE